MDPDLPENKLERKQDSKSEQKKQKEPDPSHDVESGIGVGLGLGHGVAIEMAEHRAPVAAQSGGADNKLVELRAKLKEAEERYQKAKADVDHPGTGRWLKYVVFTATEQANTVESSDFATARAAMLGGVLGMAGTMVSYILPAIKMDEVQDLNNAVNTTAPSQHATDQANIDYYWGNAGAYGFLSLTALIGGLAGIRRSYKAMRERILARAEHERDQAQTKLDKHVEYTAVLNEARQRYAALEKARDEERARTLRAQEAQVQALERLAQTEAALGKSQKDSAVLDVTLQQQKTATAAEQDKAKDLKGQVDGLLRELEQARQHGKMAQEEVDRLGVRAKELSGALDVSKLEVQKLELQVEALRQESDTAKLVVGMLENSAKRLEQIDKRIADASTQINQLSERAQQAAHSTATATASTQTDK